MEFWKSLSGMLTVEFIGADPEKILDTIIMARIPLSNVVQKKDLVYQLSISRSDYHRLAEILRQQGANLRIVRRRGFYWAIKYSMCRPVLLGCFLLFFILSFLLPSRIYFVTVEGNTTIPDRLILSAAENCGIRFAASRKLVRSEKVKNALLSTVPQLQWAGINTSGCTAVISVRERIKEQPEQKDMVSNLIAERDGYILSSTVTSGTAHVAPGETVTEGQLLISGYTDCGICIRASRAEGEILAQTNRKLYAVTPDTYLFPETVPKNSYAVSMIIGKKRINLWKDSRISDTGCGRMYEEYFVSLPGGFQLPVAICIDRLIPYELQEVNIPEQEAHMQLLQFSENYLVHQMVAGQIIQEEQHFSHSDRLFRLDSNFTCTEMIGKEQREQIGVINGEGN